MLDSNKNWPSKHDSSASVTLTEVWIISYTAILSKKNILKISEKTEKLAILWNGKKKKGKKYLILVPVKVSLPGERT